MKRVVRVCMGSACHVKGAPGVANALQKALEEHKADTDIELMGRFCQDECQKGVVVEGPDKEWFHVRVEDVPNIVSELLEGGKS